MDSNDNANEGAAEDSTPSNAEKAVAALVLTWIGASVAYTSYKIGYAVSYRFAEWRNERRAIADATKLDRPLGFHRPEE